MLLDLITQITQINLGQGKLQIFKVFSNVKNNNNTKQADKKFATFTSSHNTLGLPLKLCIQHFHRNHNEPCVYPRPRPARKKKKLHKHLQGVQSSQEKSKTMVTLNTPIICSFSCSSEFLLHLQSSLN